MINRTPDHYDYLGAKRFGQARTTPTAALVKGLMASGV
jgi:hypothetical protein